MFAVGRRGAGLFTRNSPLSRRHYLYLFSRSSGAVRSGSATRNGQSLETEGPEEAATMDEVLAVARSLVTDRTCLLIPAWVCVACLVLAAALIRVR